MQCCCVAVLAATHGHTMLDPPPSTLHPPAHPRLPVGRCQQAAAGREGEGGEDGAVVAQKYLRLLLLPRGQACGKTSEGDTSSDRTAAENGGGRHVGRELGATPTAAARLWPAPGLPPPRQGTAALEHNCGAVRGHRLGKSSCGGSQQHRAARGGADGWEPAAARSVPLQQTTAAAPESR